MMESLGHFVRTRGVWRSLDRLVFGYLFGTERWVVFHTRLDGPPAPAEHGEFTFRPYEPGDAAALAAFEPYIRRSRFLAWIAQGCLVQLALHADRPVAFRIVSTRGPRGPLAQVVRLGPDEVWVVDLYCRPEYRGRGVPLGLVRSMDRRLAAAGYRSRYSAARLDNLPGARSAFKRGAGFHALVTYRRRLFRQTLTVSTDLEEALAAAGLR
jgi:GNAT superfamily N-acetyltransferase